MAAHSPSSPIVPSVMPYLPPTGWDTWLREIAEAINLIGATLENSITPPMFVDNTTGLPATVTLPPAPAVNQTHLVKDVAGNAGTHNITIVAPPHTIEGQPSLVIQYDYGWARLAFTGSLWVQV